MARFEDKGRLKLLSIGCFILAGIAQSSLWQAVNTAAMMNRDGDYGLPVPDYIEENVAGKDVKLIQRYTEVVDRMVWKKETPS